MSFSFSLSLLSALLSLYSQRYSSPGSHNALSTPQTLSHPLELLPHLVPHLHTQTLLGSSFLRVAKSVCRAWRAAALAAEAHVAVARNRATIGREGWAPFAIGVLPDSGWLCVSDPSKSQLVLLTPTGATRGAVRFDSTAAFANANFDRADIFVHANTPPLVEPRGICSARARTDGADENASALLYVVDGGRRGARVVRFGLRADGLEASTRRQFGPDSRLVDPQEGSLSSDGRYVRGSRGGCWLACYLHALVVDSAQAHSLQRVA